LMILLILALTSFLSSYAMLFVYCFVVATKRLIVHHVAVEHTVDDPIARFRCSPLFSGHRLFDTKPNVHNIIAVEHDFEIEAPILRPFIELSSVAKLARFNSRNVTECERCHLRLRYGTSNHRRSSTACRVGCTRSYRGSRRTSCRRRRTLVDTRHHLRCMNLRNLPRHVHSMSIQGHRMRRQGLRSGSSRDCVRTFEVPLLL